MKMEMSWEREDRQRGKRKEKGAVAESTGRKCKGNGF
jgi:hypothetical protein